jgi:nucleoside 2-deoxyribosyltransferase
MKVYIAGPLFNEIERERNARIRDMLVSLGFETYLPQEDGGIAQSLIAQGADMAQTRAAIFARDTDAIDECGIFLAILDGRVPDEGACIELGMAYAQGKTCIGFLTDMRKLDEHGINLMIEGCLSATARSEEELEEIFTAFRTATEE